MKASSYADCCSGPFPDAATVPISSVFLFLDSLVCQCLLLKTEKYNEIKTIKLSPPQ